jgi:glycosyltransferase involved in cell wall biosynthesis
MRITFFYPKKLPVTKYGGTQRIIYWLMKELVLLGNHVSLISHPQSKVDDIGVSPIPHVPHEKNDWRSLVPKDTDVLFLSQTPTCTIDFPFVVRIGGNGRPGEQFHENTIFLSKKHAQNHCAVDYIHNGLDCSEYPAYTNACKNWKHFGFLARANWDVKNLHHCILACKTRKKHLHVGGGRAWSLSPFIHSYGMVDQKKKINLLSKCDAFLFPVRWHEPFGIAIIEAMAMGLPVIGSPYGSLPEIITESTGKICFSYKEFEDTVGIIRKQFRPNVLRSYVETHFSANKMARAYIKRFEKVRDGDHIQPCKPVTKIEFSNKEVLPF